MLEQARKIAEAASFQAFINGYLREINAGKMWNVREWLEFNTTPTLCGEFLIELELPKQGQSLILDLAYKSTVGCHTINAVYGCLDQSKWSRVGFWDAIQLLVTEIYAVEAVTDPLGLCQQELVNRLEDSLQNMMVYFANNPHPVNPLENFCIAEQSLLCGHWLHPTPKSRQGMQNSQHRLFAPELHGEFHLHYFAVEHELVRWESNEVNPDPIAICLAAADWPLEILEENEVLIPVHPLQAEWLLHREDLKPWFASGRIRSLGKVGNVFTATSSVRTVFQEQFPWMFKFSVPVKITNSFRQNKKHELLVGVIMSRLYERIGFSRQWPSFQLISDPAFITVELPGFKESGFEVIIRRNPFMDNEGQGKVTLAALLQDNWSAESKTKSPLQKLIRDIAEKEKRSELMVAHDWFDQYWNCAIEPLLMLLDIWGIGLEAHQQNSLIDVSKGYPSAYYYRDNQGFYLAECERAKLLDCLPELDCCPELFYERDMILNRLTYYLIVNHLFAVIYRLGRDGYANEQHWLDITQKKLMPLQARMCGLGYEFIRRLLTKDTLPTKANLLTRIKDIDELDADMEMAVYVTLSNPLRIANGMCRKEYEVEYA